jgi:deoxyadenosine/deoxycytidine kinase
MQRSHQLNKYFSESLIEQQIVSDFIFEKEDLFAGLNLSADEYKVFAEVKSKFYINSPKPDLVIYLQASPKQLLNRVKERGKVYEEQISLEYLEKICEMYSEFFFSYYDSPLLVINVDNLDFVSNPEDYNELVTHIKRDVVGKEYINLSQTIF